MEIFCQDDVILLVSEFISKNYPLKKVAVYVDENEINQALIYALEKSLTNKVIENKEISEDVAFCVLCGSYEFQQDCLKKITKHNLPYGIVVSNLSQSSFILPCLQGEVLTKINSPKFVAFEKQHIKKQPFSNNLAVVSFLQSRMVSMFEKEYYARVFEKNYVLEIKQKLLSVCNLIDGIMEIKHKNIQTANLKILDAIIKYLKLQQKYSYLQEFDTISNFAHDLTKSVFKNFYENMFVASVFATSLMEKYFALSFKNSYTFSYENSLKFCPDNFNENIIDFKNALITKNLCYKLQVNKEYFLSELFQIKTKLILKKYDYLCIFSDFGYKLTQILQKCNIKNSILKVANLKTENLFKQARNVGLLDF